MKETKTQLDQHIRRRGVSVISMGENPSSSSSSLLMFGVQQEAVEVLAWLFSLPHMKLRELPKNETQINKHFFLQAQAGQ